MLLLLQTAALHSFMLFKIYTTDQNQKSKDCRYGFKDFILDCKKMTDPAQTEDEGHSGEMHHWP